MSFCNRSFRMGALAATTAIVALAASSMVPAAASAANVYGQPSLTPPTLSMTSVKPLISGGYVECSLEYHAGERCYGATGPARAIVGYPEGSEEICVGATGTSEKGCGGSAAIFPSSGEHEPWIEDVSGSGDAYMYVEYA